MIETKVCKDCGHEQWTVNFKYNPETGLHHALCHHCRRIRKERQEARWEYYHR